MKVFVDAPLLIYLNTLTDESLRAPYTLFYEGLLSRFKAYTDVLVLDEVLYISHRKYGVPYEASISFIESAVLPYISVLSLAEHEYQIAVEVLKKHGVRPSDALHVGAMKANGIELIASEDQDFDKIEEIKRLWLGFS